MEQSKYRGAGSNCSASLEVLCYLCKPGIKFFEFTSTCHSPETVDSLPIITHYFLMTNTHNALQPVVPVFHVFQLKCILLVLHVMLVSPPTSYIPSDT